MVRETPTPPQVLGQDWGQDMAHCSAITPQCSRSMPGATLSVPAVPAQAPGAAVPHSGATGPHSVCTQHCPSTLPTPPCCCVPLSCSCPSLRGAAPQQVRFRTRWDPSGFNRGGFHCSQNPGAHLHCRICPTPPTPPPAGTALGFPPRELSSPTKNKRCSSNVCMGSTSRFIES